MTVALILGAQIVFLLYFLLLNGVYLLLNFLSYRELRQLMLRRDMADLPQIHAGLEPPITILAPAYNEGVTIAASVRSLLQLVYPAYEVVVINDGSRDDTLAVLQREFDLVPFPEACRDRLPCRPIRAVYASSTYPNLRVIDKENGGKADALNAGINLARYRLFCCMDADSVLQRDSLSRIVQPFLEDPRTVACGGTIRVANGCRVRDGSLISAGLPRSLLARMQIVEYLRAFLFGRLGWMPLNALLVISGAFGLFDKETVVAVGGYRTDTVGEDMELVVRLHRVLREKGREYRVAFIPDPICWTEAPEDLRTLKNQRVRWQRGLAESLMLNRGLLFSRRGGTPGWVAFPFMLAFEMFGPALELVGFGFMSVCFWSHQISAAAWWAFLLVAIGLGVLLSTSGLLLEELAFHAYPRLRDLFGLFMMALAENLGYRQLNAYWRLIGLYRWLRGGKAQWGTMVRKASWDTGCRAPRAASESPAPGTRYPATGGGAGERE
jgi:cellulose synthase/poly-beta-1,6-N-acetylglucosamine synthase-like glycosyltransferase